MKRNALRLGCSAVRVVLASNNAKKLAELRALFAELPLEWSSSVELGISEPDEPHATFVENALAKARHAARVGSCASLADDSGLCVAALGGAPGVASAHYANVHLPSADRETQRRIQDAANNVLLLERLRGVTDRRAHYVSVLVALRHAEDPDPLITRALWVGDIVEIARGVGGFGYDPLLYIPELGRCVAELDPATKNRVSHRALAAQEMLAAMREGWRLA